MASAAKNSICCLVSICQYGGEHVRFREHRRCNRYRGAWATASSNPRLWRARVLETIKPANPLELDSPSYDDEAKSPLLRPGS